MPLYINKEAEEQAKHIEKKSKQLFDELERVYNKTCIEISNTPKFLTVNWKALQAIEMSYLYGCWSEADFSRDENYVLLYKKETLVRVDPTLVDGVVYFSQT